MTRFTGWVAAAAAVALLLVVVAIAAINWRGIGDAGIDLNGWIALILGVVVTSALGIGLMALVFISNRRGYDEPPREDK